MLRIEHCGAVLDTNSMDPWKLLLCVLSGPVGSLSLLMFARRIPRIALCGMAQGCFNLLPIYPLDGGRALRCLSEMFFSEYTVRNICAAAEWLSVLIILGAGVYGSFILGIGLIPVLTAVVFLYRLWCGKISCKEDKVRVQ